MVSELREALLVKSGISLSSNNAFLTTRLEYCTLKDLKKNIKNVLFFQSHRM